MDLPGRRYLCARCRTAVIICSHCDRGHRYCTITCADQARRTAVQAAGCRYQATRRGRHAHAERQRRYRAKPQKVTHQGSPPKPPAVPLRFEPIVPVNPGRWQCCRCHRPLPDWVRLDFLRGRIRRNRLYRNTHGPYRLRRYAAPDLLVVDEVGYLSYSNRHADLLFELINRRHEKKSTLITTNKAFSEWSEVFPNASCVVAMIDRLVHHAEILSIKGESYRRKEAQEQAAAKSRKRKMKEYA